MNRENKNYEQLFDGVKQFQDGEFVSLKNIFNNLENSQKPHTLFIGCSDSRVIPNLITNSMPGELFIVRNVANMIPYFQPDSNAFLATSSAIEYAVKALEVENIIVCGHSNCGGCKALYAPREEMDELPMVRKWMDLALPVKAKVEDKIQRGEYAKELRYEITEKLNVVEQMEHLLTFPYIKEKYEAGQLNILGWYYVIHTGEVFNYSEEKKVFEKIE